MINKSKNNLSELADMINESAIIKNFDRLKLRLLRKVLKDHVSAEQLESINEHFNSLVGKTTKIKVDLLKSVRKGSKKTSSPKHRVASKAKAKPKKVPKKVGEAPREMIHMTRAQFQNLDNDQQDHLIKILTNPAASNKYKQDLAKYYLGLRKDRPGQIVS